MEWALIEQRLGGYAELREKSVLCSISMQNS
jgi:hypothetical protein